MDQISCISQSPERNFRLNLRYSNELSNYAPAAGFSKTMKVQLMNLRKRKKNHDGEKQWHHWDRIPNQNYVVFCAKVKVAAIARDLSIRVFSARLVVEHFLVEAFCLRKRRLCSEFCFIRKLGISTIAIDRYFICAFVHFFKKLNFYLLLNQKFWYCSLYRLNFPFLSRSSPIAFKSHSFPIFCNIL